MKAICNFTTLSTVVLLVACGGGGGGGGGGQPPLGEIAYTGKTTPAPITDENAERITSAAFLGPDLPTEDIGPFRMAADESTSPPTARYVLRLLRDTIRQAIEQGVGRRDSARRSLYDTVTESWTDPGPCGGTAGYTVTANDVTGDFTGRVTFTNFDDCESVVNGPATISGNIDLAMLAPNWMELHAGVITVVTGEESHSLSGTMSIDYRTYPLPVTMDMRFRDNGTGEVFWYEDYVTTEGTSGANQEMTISGKYYDPAYGFVVVSTESPFHTDMAGNWPFEGVLRATGGAASTAWLIAVDAYLYRVETDVDGDGTAELVGPNLHWPGANREPLTDGTVDAHGNVGCPLNLDGSGFDADGDVLAYSWQILEAPAGSNAVISNATSERPSFLPDARGEYLFEVAVSDGYASSTVSVGPVTVEGGRFCSGNGSGLVQVGSQGTGVAIADLNGDGRNDIAFVTGYYDSLENDGKLFVLLQDGLGGMSAPIRYDLDGSFSNRPSSVAVGDLNGDGKSDIAVGLDRYGIQILLQNALGGLASSQVLYAWDSTLVKIGDLNHDGQNDLAGIGWGSDTATVWYGGSLDAPVTYDISHGGYDEIEVQDLNSDGRRDLVVMSGQGLSDSFGILFQDDGGNLSLPVYYGLGNSTLPDGLATGDLNGDGRRDVALSHLGAVSTFLQNASGSLDAPIEYPFMEGASGALSVGDFNSDGRQDLVAGYDGYGVGLAYQEGDGTLAPFENYSIPVGQSSSGVQFLVAGDVNGDGLDDVVGGMWGGIVIFRNTGHD